MSFEYQSAKKISKRKVLLFVGIAVAILVVSAAIGFFASMTTARVVDDTAVKDEIITQNTRLRLSMVDDVLTADAIAKVKSSDSVNVTLKVASDAKSYCIEATAKDDPEAVKYHMFKDTPDTEPVSGLCGDNAKTAPAKPTSFTVGAAGAWSSSFIWAAVPDAKTYEVQCAVTKNFDSPKTAKSRRAEAKVDDLSPGIKYFCRVAAENSAGKSGWSDVLEVVTKVELAVPKELKITTVSSTSLSYSWAAVPGAKQYILEYATNAAFSEGVQQLKTTSTQGTLTGLAADKGYYFHLKVITATATEQQAPFSASVQGRTPK